MRGRILLLVFPFMAASAKADLFDAFDSGNGGWTVADVSPTTLEVLDEAPAGWRDGRLEATEFGSGLFVFRAPKAYEGDLSGYYGGSVGFTLSDASRDGVPYPNLLIRGNGFAMAYVTPPPSATGTAYIIPLTEAGWIGLDLRPVGKAQFQNALANVDRFGINADWATRTADVTTLDDVRVVAPVPEPATLAALGLGLAAFLRRRR